MSQFDDYDDLHRACVQTLMGYGTIEKKEFENIFRKLSQKFTPDEQIQANTLDQIVEMINEKIGPFDQKVIKYKYGLTDQEFYVFYTSAKTSISKFQNAYNEAELEFFKVILMKFAEQKDLSISPREALNLSGGIVGRLPKMRADKLIENWTLEGYFYKHTDNKLYLGPKLLNEFKELLQSFDLDYLRSCLLCENIALWGDCCGSCGTIFHHECIRKFLSRSDKCPSCKEKWKDSTNENGGDVEMADNDD